MRRIAVLVALLATAGARARADDLTADERALLVKVDAEDYVKARDQAEHILAAHPSSFVACWAMALIQHNEEGNDARALYFVRRAEALLARRGLDPSWHKKMLLEEIDILFEMDRNADVLKRLDYYDALYGPTHSYLRIWPLFKLGRMDEARAIARKLATSSDYDERLDGYNGMLSLEFEAHNREASYRWAVDGVRATQGASCTILRNAAGAAFTFFRLGEAEDFALRAHEARHKDCAHGGYDQLAGIYLAEGEFQKTLAALETLKKEHISRRLRPHFALTRRTILSDLLYALGKVEDAERIAGELYGMPERTGLISTSKTMERFARTLRTYMALEARIVLEAERASYRWPLAGLGLDLARQLASRWELSRALIQLSAEDDLVVNVTRPNLGEINDLPAWRVGGMIDVLGAGVMRAAIARARKLDAPYPQASAYLDAFAGEVAFRTGELADADRLATAALAHLPREEALLRWRTQAWQADALRRLGRMKAARPLYQEVLQRFPSALRFLDLRVPATVETDGSKPARAAGERLARSRRFIIMAGAPFRLRVARRGDALEVCLRDDRGFQFTCQTGKPGASVDAVLDAFHAAAFSPKVSLTQSDLSSLDGTPVRVDADTLLKGVLEP